MNENKTIKWGLIGLGKIAHKFAKDLALVEGVELEAVASRSIQNAKEFAEKHHAKKFYGSYEELVSDASVDIVYIATTNNSHAEITQLALAHKKAVLCEKPFAINTSQVLNMIASSKNNNTFLMEAMWSRFNPVLKAVKKSIDHGEIGEIKYLHADFSFKASPSIQRVHDISLGGGSLLDIGIYPVFLSYLILGLPKTISATAKYFDSGTDSQLAMLFDYDKTQAMLFSSFNSNSKREAKISGTEGEIIIDAPWNESNSFSIHKGNEIRTVSLPTVGRGYSYEIQECNSKLKEGKTQSELWSHQNSVDLIAILDKIRKIIGVNYAEDAL